MRRSGASDPSRKRTCPDALLGNQPNNGAKMEASMGVEAWNGGSISLQRRWSPEVWTDEMRRRPMSDERRARLRKHRAGKKPACNLGRSFSAAEDAMLGTDNDGVIAAKIGRARAAVTVRRIKLGISACRTRQFERRTLTLKGVTRPMAEWAKVLDIPYARLKSRKYLGWTDEEILTRDSHRGLSVASQAAPGSD